MNSSSAINFSTRQNKAIERALVFEGLNLMKSAKLLDDPTYVGFGSLWFADFHLAHRSLGINSLISIEANDGKFSRATFNRPFNNILVLHGTSGALLPGLLADKSLSQRAWVLWLDYDRSLFREEVADLQTVAAEIPPGSVILTTFNAYRSNYNSIPNDKSSRIDLLVDLFGDNLTADLIPESVDRQANFYQTMAKLTQETIQSHAINGGHDAGYVPMFDIKYSDGVEMLTVGGYFPKNAQEAEAARTIASSPNWPGIQFDAVSLPSLTMKEVIAMRSLLPSEEALTPERVEKALGFRLSESTLSGFSRHYLRFPVYSDVAHVL